MKEWRAWLVRRNRSASPNRERFNELLLVFFLKPGKYYSHISP